MLFDEFDRCYTGYRNPTEGSFEFLNRSARPEWHQVRATLEAWFTAYPSVDAVDLRSRFRSRLDRSHYGAWWELYVFTLLSALGFAVKVHPLVATGSRRPDFHAVGHGERIFVEAVTTASGIVDDERDPEREGWIEEAINATESPDFFVHLDFDDTGVERPSRVEVTREVDAWLSELDPDEVRKAYDLIGELPSLVVSVRDWKLRLRAIPKSRHPDGNDVGAAPRRLVGAGPVTAGAVDDIERIRAGIDEKRKAYGQLPDPLVVAQLCLSSTANDETISEVLFGNLAVQFHRDRPEAAHTIHQPNGIWTRPRRSIDLGVSALLVGVEQLLPWTVGHRAPTLWTNPTEADGFSSWYPLRRICVSDGRLVTEPATAEPWEVLGLSPSWPSQREPE